MIAGPVKRLTVTPTHTATLDGPCPTCGRLVRKEGPLVECEDGSAEIRPATITDRDGIHRCQRPTREAA